MARSPITGKVAGLLSARGGKAKAPKPKPNPTPDTGYEAGQAGSRNPREGTNLPGSPTNPIDVSGTNVTGPRKGIKYPVPPRRPPLGKPGPHDPEPPRTGYFARPVR